MKICFFLFSVGIILLRTVIEVIYMTKKLIVSQSSWEYQRLLRSLQEEVSALRQQNNELKRKIIKKDTQYIALEKYAMNEINTLQSQLMKVLIEGT